MPNLRKDTMIQTRHKTYKVGHFYEEYNNLVGLYPPSENPIGDKTIVIYRYIDRFYNSTLRFKREEGENGFRWRLTEIYDAYQHSGLVELPTVSNPNIELVDRLRKAGL